MIYYSKDWWS